MIEWSIPVSWEVCGMVKIKANTLEEAIHTAIHDDSIELPYDVDFKVASVVCMYAMSNRSLANSYYLNIEGELTNQQKEYIAAFKYRN